MKHIQNEHIMKSIPLLASILGDRYGIEIIISGDSAMTDGNTIYLPALPLDCDDTFLGLLRGFLDHEAAHIRYTDFDLVKNEKLSNFEHFVWNCIEDWRIESKMARHFTGCKLNFHWLIYHVFITTKKKKRQQKLEDMLADWILLSIRSWNVEELEKQTKALEKHINIQCPRLLSELGAILLEVKNKCKTCEEALYYAKAIVACIENYIKQLEQQQSEANQPNQAKIKLDLAEGENNETSDGNDTSGNTTESNARCDGQDDAIASLGNLLAGNSNSLPNAVAEIAKDLIEKSSVHGTQDRMKVALIGNKKCTMLAPSCTQRALRVSTSLKARLQGLLQAQSLIRQLPSSHGKINKNRLHGLAVNDTRLFLQNTKQKATNTAIHVLLDASGSMRGRMDIANEATFALASALFATKGINPAVTVFPAQHSDRNLQGGKQYVYVSSLLKHGEKISNKFNIQSEGSTPLTESLWWAYSQLLAQKEERKIILLITDGEPDNRDTALHAIQYAEKIGIEIYGVGIPPCLIEDILPNKSIRIESINQLPQAMFGLLQSKLVGK